jgi:hypothetical protein
MVAALPDAEVALLSSGKITSSTAVTGFRHHGKCGLVLLAEVLTVNYAAESYPTRTASWTRTGP